MVSANPLANLSGFGRLHLVAHLAHGGRFLFVVEDCGIRKLNAGQIPQALYRRFQEHAITLTPQSLRVFTEKTGVEWTLVTNDEIFGIHRKYHVLEVFTSTYDELHRLLALETGEQRNAWYEIKESHGEEAGYLQDIEVARTRAVEIQGLASSESNLAARSNGMEFNYALILATVNSLSGSIPIELLVALVENNVWTPTRSMAYIQRIPDEKQRVDTLVQLVPYLADSDEVLTQALAEITDRLEDPKHVATAIVGLAPYLRGSLLQAALDTALSIKEMDYFKFSQVAALVGLAPYLSEQMLQEVVNTIPVLGYHGQDLVIMAVAPRLPQHLLQQVVDMFEHDEGGL